MKIFLNKKKLSDKNTVLELLQISFMPSLIEDNLIFLFASIFNLLWYIILTELYEKKVAPHKYVVRKKEVY